MTSLLFHAAYNNVRSSEVQHLIYISLVGRALSRNLSRRFGITVSLYPEKPSTIVNFRYPFRTESTDIQSSILYRRCACCMNNSMKTNRIPKQHKNKETKTTRNQTPKKEKRRKEKENSLTFLFLHCSSTPSGPRPNRVESNRTWIVDSRVSSLPVRRKNAVN